LVDHRGRLRGRVRGVRRRAVDADQRRVPRRLRDRPVPARLPPAGPAPGGEVTVAEKAHRPAGRAMDGGILPGRPPRPALTSVVIPAYNAAATIGAQLDALAAQTYNGAWEVLVCDNGSSDTTLEVVASYTDRLPRLRVV